MSDTGNCSTEMADAGASPGDYNGEKISKDGEEKEAPHGSSPGSNKISEGKSGLSSS
jgi:hypothetical protein